MTGLTYTEPLLCFFFLLAFAGLLPLWLKPGSAKPVLPTIALAGLFLVSWPPVDWLLSRPLETPYQRTLLTHPSAPQAIVVPASGVEPARWHFPVALPDADTYARCRYAAFLYREWKPLPIFVSGGNPVKSRPSFAATMVELLISSGVPAEAITAETRSLNTYENAAYTAGLLRAKGIREIAVVAEADSMLRLDLCFRRQGLTVVPAPYRRRSIAFTLDDLLPSRKAIARNELTLHEMLGLAWYRMRGWI